MGIIQVKIDKEIGIKMKIKLKFKILLEMVREDKEKENLKDHKISKDRLIQILKIIKENKKEMKMKTGNDECNYNLKKKHIKIKIS